MEGEKLTKPCDAIRVTVGPLKKTGHLGLSSQLAEDCLGY